MNTVAGSGKETPPNLTSTSLGETKIWTVEKPEQCYLAEWIEFGRKLRRASDAEIRSLISELDQYLEGKPIDETPLSIGNGEHVRRGYARTTRKAAMAELRKRDSQWPGGR